MLGLCALAVTPGASSRAFSGRYTPPIMMGGLTGLPRIPKEALSLTRSWNPGCEYTERIATLWRDLETLYGIEAIAGVGGSRTGYDASRLVDSGVKTNKFRGFTRDVDMRVATVLKAVRREPSLLNPEASNRFDFATSKAILVDTLGSQQASAQYAVHSACIVEYTLVHHIHDGRIIWEAVDALKKRALLSMQAAIGVMQQDPSILQLGDALEEMSSGSIRARAASKQLVASWPSLVLAVGLVALAATDLGSDVPQIAAAKQALSELSR